MRYIIVLYILKQYSSVQTNMSSEQMQKQKNLGGAMAPLAPP